MKKLFTPLMLLMAFFVSFKVYASPALNSFPSAAATIYLDFDGYDVNSAYWGGGSPFTCEGAGLNDGQVTEVFNRVAEDFRPFDINVTTDEAVFLAAPLSSRVRVVITPTSNWCPGVSGVALVGSFSWGDDTPVFVFSNLLGPNNPKMVGDCCSHEIGHSLGLYHKATYDGNCNLTSIYDGGTGVGETGWAPIMGNSYSKNLSRWTNGLTPYGCTNLQDELDVIVTQNGFGFRPDDYSDDIKIAPQPIVLSGADVHGIISTSNDKDAFSFNLAAASKIHIAVRPFAVDSSYNGDNLDVKLLLYNAAYELVATYDPSSTLVATIDTTLSAGSWYLVTDGAGNLNANDYGSLGAYSISSIAIPVTMLSVTLTGKDELNEHVLNWNIRSNEHVKSVEVELSADGLIFNTVNTVSGIASDYIYTPIQSTDLFYRVKATSVLNHSTYSNTIKLKKVAPPAKSFTVSTLVQTAITVKAPENFQYMLSDMRGNLVARANGVQGTNRLDVSRLPGGMYVLQLMHNNQRQTEKIIKQ